MPAAAVMDNGPVMCFLSGPSQQLSKLHPIPERSAVWAPDSQAVEGEPSSPPRRLGRVFAA